MTHVIRLVNKLEPISKSETHHWLNPRHSGAGRNPVFFRYVWMPAYAGMTE